MDFLYFFLLLPLLWSLFHVLKFISNTQSGGTARLPPGPRALPIIGNILDLGKSPHESITRLSKLYGPLMSLKLGTRTTIVVSSPQMAKEVLQKQDQIFSGRTVPAALEVLDHHKYSMGVLPPEAQWKQLRSTVKEHIFSSRSLNATRGIRQKTVHQLVAHVRECCAGGEVVDIGRAAFTAALNLISNTFFSKDLCEYRSKSAHEFSDIVCKLVETAGAPHVADFFPVLKRLDLQGILRKSEHYHEKLLGIVGGMVDRRDMEVETGDREESSADRDFLDVLLKLSKEEGNQLKHVQIKHLLMDLFIAGTDTVSSTVEWVMAELLRNPNKLAKAKTELKSVIGNDRIVEETDISNLPYLQAVVKETLRLHSPIPFLIPHKAEADAEINGFSIPKNAQIFINVWGMGRDPDIWPDPLVFTPERFLDNQVDFIGTKFELIPFGAGRRMCPGQPLGSRMLHSIIGSLLLSFDWKLEKGILKPEDLDMSASFGFTLQKTVPLKAIPIEV